MATKTETKSGSAGGNKAHRSAFSWGDSDSGMLLGAAAAAPSNMPLSLSPQENALLWALLPPALPDFVSVLVAISTSSSFAGATFECEAGFRLTGESEPHPSHGEI